MKIKEIIKKGLEEFEMIKLNEIKVIEKTEIKPRNQK